MPIPTLPYVTAGQRATASDRNAVKDYLDYLLNPPAVSAYRSAATATISTASWSNAIGMETEDFDRDGMHDNATSNSRIVFFQTAGRYQVTARMTFEPNATGFRACETRLNANGLYTGGSLMSEATAAAATAGKKHCSRAELVARLQRG